MKRTLSVMLSVFWFFTGILHAHDFVVDGIAYNILSPGQVEVTYKGSEVNEAPYAGDVKIPESVINDGITYQVTKLGNNCFSGTSGLTSVELPESIESIGSYAFYRSAIKSLRLPASVKQISDHFVARSSIRELYCPFEHPGSLAIYENAFLNDETQNILHDFDKIYVPAKSLDEYLRLIVWVRLDRTTSDTNVLQEYGGDLFEVDGVKYGIIDESSSEAAVFRANETSYYKGDLTIQATVTKNGKQYKVTRINRRAFCGSYGLTGVTMPETIETIAAGAFLGCGKLVNALIPSGVTQIPEMAFDGCHELRYVVISDNVTSIGENAFNGCANVKDLTLGKNLLSVGKNSLPSPSRTLYHRRARPYVFYNDEMVGHRYSTCVLYIPKGTLQLFSITSPWNGYMRMEEFDTGDSPTPSPVKGDLNEDGEVSVADLTMLAGIIMGTAEPTESAGQ